MKCTPLIATKASMASLAAMAAIATMTISSCGDSPRVAGGVDGNPNFLEGRLVLPSDGGPAARVPVVLSSSDASAARSLATGDWTPRDTAWTDSDGRFRFALSRDGRYLLQARLGDSLVMSRDLEYNAATGIRLEAAVVPVPSGKVLVVADFEPSGSTASLAPWFADAYGLRLLYNDTDRIAITPSGIRTDPDSGIVDCAEQGRCYRLATAALIPNADADLTEIYEGFRPSSRDCFDLSGADSVTVRVRGTGDVHLSWWGKDAALAWADWSMPSRTFTLSASWQDLSIPTDSIRFGSGSDSIPWSGSCIHKFTFGLRGAGELWIDDIRLHGSSLLDLQTP